MAEEMEVISGELVVSIAGVSQTYTPGQKVLIPAGQPHMMWNPTDQDAVVNWKIWPAMNLEHLMETAAGLSADGKTNDKGMPCLLHTSMLHVRFSDVFRLASPNYTLQCMLLYTLAPIAFVLGYKPSYKRYID